jgi:hypothetical protein
MKKIETHLLKKKTNPVVNKISFVFTDVYICV